MRADTAYLLLAIASLALFMVLLVEWLWQGGAVIHRRARNRRERMAALAQLPEILRNSPMEEKRSAYRTWNSYAGQRISRAGWKIGPGPFLFITATGSMLAMVMTFTVSGNVFTTVAVAMLFIFVPMQLLNISMQRQTQKVVNQLPAAIQLFVVEFETLKNMKEAMSRAAEGAESPLRKHLQRCANDLASGKRPREAFKRLAVNLDCDYGLLWTQLLLAALEDATVVKMMPKLIARLASQRMLIQKNSAELSGEKRIGLILNFFILPAFIMVQIAFPDSREFYGIPLGRLAIVFVFLSVVVGMALDQLLSKVEV